ncbi:MAG TPA: LPS export ABC transporter permease LptG [Casimicrobiaceae bacterium]|jgi:lipopolysaccharide export system permease protein
MKTLQRYIGRDVLGATLFIFAALIMLFAFFDLIHELGDVGRNGYTMSAAVLFVTLNIPSRLYELFPVAALIGTLFGIAQLVANSEYTVMRASGMSLAQVIWSVLRVGIPLAVATFLAGEYIAPPAERLAQTVRSSGQASANRIVARQFASGFWFKQDLTFVNVRTVLADMKLLGVRIYEFDRDLRLKAVHVAESASYVPVDNKWHLIKVRSTEISPQGTRVTSDPELDWESVLRPSILSVYQVPPERLDLTALYDNIKVLGASAQKTSRFEIALWNKIFYPAAVLVMMILALPFAHFQRRQGGVGFRIFVGTILGLAFFLVGRTFSHLGVLNDWNPLFSAVFPLAFFTCLAIGMMWYIERR